MRVQIAKQISMLEKTLLIFEQIHIIFFYSTLCAHVQIHMFKHYLFYHHRNYSLFYSRNEKKKTIVIISLFERKNFL